MPCKDINKQEKQDMLKNVRKNYKLLAGILKTVTTKKTFVGLSNNALHERKVLQNNKPVN